MQTMLPRLPIKTYRSRDTKNWEEEKQLVGKEINRKEWQKGEKW